MVKLMDYNMENENKTIELDITQQTLIVNEWNSRPTNPPSISELITKVFPNQNSDPRTIYGRAIKEFLVARGIKGKEVTEKKEPIILTDEHKEYIKNNYSNMKALEMARILYNKPTLTPLTKEAKLVYFFEICYHRSN